MIYLDNAATSLVKPLSVKRAVDYAMENYTANPGRGGHDLSIKTGEIIFETRENIKDFFGAKSYEIIFTKNCTEALNLAIFGTLKSGDHVITTCYEHNSILRPLNLLKSIGVSVTILDCDLKDLPLILPAHIIEKTALVITTFVSNVTGEITDVKAISKLCKKHKIKYLIDGAQACGHIDINMEDIGADMLAFSGHKGLLSITGVGGLIVKNIHELTPLIYGGTGTDSSNFLQSTNSIEGFEAGTIPTIPIISLNAGISFLKKNFSKIIKTEHDLCDVLYKKLKNIKNLTLLSNSKGLNVYSFVVENVDSSQVANILNDRFKICVRAGLHCAPLVHKKFGTDNVGAVRVSVDFYNTIEELEYFIFALDAIANGRL